MRVHFSAIKTLCGASLLFAIVLAAAPVSAAEASVAYFRAVQIDNADAVTELLSANLSPNIREPNSGESGLVLALRNDAMKVFQVLMAQPAIELELNAKNGNTALMMAAFRKNKPALLALLDKGAQVNRAGWTALHYAAASGDDEIVQILLERHAHINAAAPAGITPLMIAAREAHQFTVQLLLDAGADASLKSSDGNTAADYAERADQPLIVAAIRASLAAKK